MKFDSKRIAHEMELSSIRDPIARAIQSEATRRQSLRQFYRLVGSQIQDAGSAEWGIDPYEVDWISIFTPIELALWHDIRAADLVMYPQYPIKWYFVDFANPAAKVCIECDGSQWHQDTEKDAIRQRNIEAQGWTMYRITGRACKTDSDPETGAKSAAREFIDYIAERHPVCRHPEDC